MAFRIALSFAPEYSANPTSATTAPPSICHDQSLVSPNNTRENRNSIATLTFPSTVVVVALVTAMTLE